jgi:hypothetical protein
VSYPEADIEAITAMLPSFENPFLLKTPSDPGIPFFIEKRRPLDDFHAFLTGNVPAAVVIAPDHVVFPVVVVNEEQGHKKTERKPKKTPRKPPRALPPVSAEKTPVTPIAVPPVRALTPAPITKEKASRPPRPVAKRKKSPIIETAVVLASKAAELRPIQRHGIQNESSPGKGEKLQTPSGWEMPELPRYDFDGQIWHTRARVFALERLFRLIKEDG